MNKILYVTLITSAALMFLACQPPAPAANSANTTNTTANTATKPAATAPTADALLAMDKQANAAYLKGDAAFFQGFLSDKFAMMGGGQKQDKAAAVKMIGGVKCDVKEGWTLDEPKMAMIDADTAVITYKGTFDGSCTANGKTEKLPSPIRAASVYTRSGDKWLAVYHGETKIVDPKTMKPEDKKETPAAAKPADKMAANSNTAPAPVADPNTDAMVAVEKAGWEAWKARDAKKLEDITTANLSFVGLFGDYNATKADTIKGWTEGKCEIKSTSITDATGVSLSPTLGFIMFKGSADGTCDNMKIEPLHGTSFYVKEGDAWKLAFGFESPA